MMRGRVVAALCLLLISAPNTLQSKPGDLHSLLASPHVRKLQGEEETARSDTKPTCRCDWNGGCTQEVHIRCVLTAVCVWASSDASSDKGNAKVGVFIAASMGTFALMAAVYCIYTKFYTKQRYLHTQLNNDLGTWADFSNTVNGLEPALFLGTVRWA